jgi:hypothetical protein
MFDCQEREFCEGDVPQGSLQGEHYSDADGKTVNSAGDQVHQTETLATYDDKGACKVPC